jgi:predicted metal-dependent hydrolase
MLKILLFLVKRRGRRTYSSKTKSHPRFLEHKQNAEALVLSRLAHFQSVYRDQFGYTLIYKKVSIKNQSSRWGSCSQKGNLNFNFRIALLPPELADYVIVHELCHLGEFNHSKKFWDLVVLTVPNWQTLRARLKQHGKSFF